MARIRVLGLALVAVVAISVVAVASASAAAPEFTVTSKFTTKGTSGTLETVTAQKVTCTAQSGKGEALKGKKVQGVFVKFTGCTTAGAVTCQSGATAGTIETKELKGALVFLGQGGTVTTKVGIELEPAGTEFVEFNCGSTLVGVKVTKEILGEIEASAIGKKIGPKTSPNHYVVKYKQSLGHQEFTEAEFENNGILLKNLFLEAAKNGGAPEQAGEETTAEVFPEVEGEIT